MKCLNGHKVACVDTRPRADGMVRRRYKCFLCTDKFTTLETRIKRTSSGTPLAKQFHEQFQVL